MVAHPAIFVLWGLLGGGVGSVLGTAKETEAVCTDRDLERRMLRPCAHFSD